MPDSEKAESERDEFRKDAERIDFMERYALVGFCMDGVEFRLMLPNDDSGGYNTIREIIDATIDQARNK